MRIEYTLALCGALLFAVGCDEVQRSASYGTSSANYPTSYGTTYGTSSTYDTPKQGQVLQSGTYATYPGTPVISREETDRELCDRVRAELNRYNDLTAVTSSLDISAQNGQVMLSGTVPTDTQRQRIHDIARHTSGVIALNDQLQIAPPPPATYGSTYGQSDQTIANQVQQALYSHPEASRCAPNVRIMVQSGRVTLSGNLSNEQDRQIVDDVVRNVPGVTGVSDQMQIAVLPTGRPQEPTRVYSPNGDNFSLHVEGLNDADRDLAQRILDGMQNQTTTVNRTWPGVTINVSNGRVILQGTVQSYDEKRSIVESVRRAAGPNNVTDEIRVMR